MIAKTHPQAAYFMFTSIFKHKFTFFMRTITIKNNFFLSPVKKAIKEKLIPALFSDLEISDELRKLALSWKLGGMGIINPS